MDVFEEFMTQYPQIRGSMTRLLDAVMDIKNKDFVDTDLNCRIERYERFMKKDSKRKEFFFTILEKFDASGQKSIPRRRYFQDVWKCFNCHGSNEFKQFPKSFDDFLYRFYDEFVCSKCQITINFICVDDIYVAPHPYDVNDANTREKHFDYQYLYLYVNARKIQAIGRGMVTRIKMAPILLEKKYAPGGTGFSKAVQDFTECCNKKTSSSKV
jgi:hypothetical protein